MSRRALGPWAAAALLALAVLVVYRPVLGFELTGDDYQMAQFAHRTLLEPHLALAPLGQFFRPLTNWSFVLDRLLWGTRPAGYHGTTLLFHLLAALALLWAGRRLGLGLPWAAGVSLLWVVSPFTDENAVWSAIRHQSFLMALWMLLIVLWPRGGERWSRARLAAAAAVVAALVLTKESWVVTPLLMVALDMAQRPHGLRPALRAAAPAGALAALYVALRFAFIPTTGGYFQLSPAPLLKVPHMLAAFLWLEELRPLAFRPTATGFLALAAVAALAWMGCRRRIPAAMMGTALVFVPLLPVLLVPFLPQRYTAIPWAGFLLLAAGLLQAASGSLQGWRRRGLWLAAGTGSVLLLLAGAAVVRKDLLDWRRVSTAHHRLIEEARRAAPGFPRDVPVLVVRAENTNPLVAVSRDPEGLFKLWYQRGPDPYGLIDAAALFDWVLDLPRSVVVDLPGPAPGRAPRARVLLHLDGGFRWVPEGLGGGGGDPAQTWRRRGLAVRRIGVAPG